MLAINIKELFFDRDKVKSAVDKATRDNLSKGAAYIRRSARESIKDRASGRSAPGQPPYSHVGAKRRKFNRLRKAAGLDPVKGGFQGVKHILFGFDPTARSVIIGPISNRKGTVTHVLEFGGSESVKQFRKGRAETKTIYIAPHPYMGPALRKEAFNLPKLWADSVKG
jgi:hypothetical protein